MSSDDNSFHSRCEDSGQGQEEQGKLESAIFSQEVPWGLGKALRSKRPPLFIAQYPVK